jgi:hypothetical protein
MGTFAGDPAPHPIMKREDEKRQKLKAWVRADL